MKAFRIVVALCAVTLILRPPTTLDAANIVCFVLFACWLVSEITIERQNKDIERLKNDKDR